MLLSFLCYAVERKLAGEEDRLKENVIGVEVFRREASFDPRIDPVVRVMAGRLRARLQKYYDGDGRGEPVRIELPKGAYVPHFRTVGVAVAPATSEPDANSAPPYQSAGRLKLVLYCAVSVVVLAAIGWIVQTRRPAAAGPRRISSIAVLPLRNLSADPEQEYFADGLTEALINDLGKIGALRVISLTSAMHYKGSRELLPQIASELHVDAVVEGAVLRSGGRVRITAQLIQAATDKHLWAETYERDLHEILSLQREVARDITNEIRLKLSPQEHAQLANTRPINPGVYETYLKGRYYQNKFTEEGLKKSIEQFESVILRDPKYALAYSGLADSYNYLGNFVLMPSREAAPKARTAATTALELDDTLAEAHTSLAYVKMNYDWNWAEAGREYQRAIALNPGYAKAHSLYAWWLASQGRFEEALVEIRRALSLDPLSVNENYHVGWHLYTARRYDQAIDQLRETVQMDPLFPMAHRVLGQAYEQRKMYKDALAEARQATRLTEGAPPTEAELAYAYAVSGKPNEAIKTLGELKALSKRKYVSWYDVAAVYAGLGEKDQALQCLERAFEERDGRLAGHVKVDQRFDGLRSDLHFQNLIQRIGLD